MRKNGVVKQSEQSNSSKNQEYMWKLALQIHVVYNLLIITCQGSLSEELRRFVHLLRMLRLLARIPGIRGYHGNVAASYPLLPVHPFLLRMSREYSRRNAQGRFSR